MGRALVLIQAASLRSAEPSTRLEKLNKRKNENPKPSDARSHADPLDATLALTLSALLGFSPFIYCYLSPPEFFSRRFFFLIVKRSFTVRCYTRYRSAPIRVYICNTAISLL